MAVATVQFPVRSAGRGAAGGVVVEAVVPFQPRNCRHNKNTAAREEIMPKANLSSDFPGVK